VKSSRKSELLKHGQTPDKGIVWFCLRELTSANRYPVYYELESNRIDTHRIHSVVE